MKKTSKIFLLTGLVVLLTASVITALALTSHIKVQDGKLILSLTSDNVLFYDDFNGVSLASPWLVEDTGSQITAYYPLTPSPGHFMVSTRVSSSQLAAFALRLHCGPTPILSSKTGIQLEMNSGVMHNGFVASGTSPSDWTWNTITGPANVNTWYILEMVVQQSPFSVTYNVYDDNNWLIGTYSRTDFSITYQSIDYICLKLWNGPASYSIDWIKVTS